MGDRYDPDRWLEGRSEESEPVLPKPFGPSSTGDWYRVRHSVLAAARLIEAEANRAAPGFVAEQGTIGIEILPVSVWGGGLPRIRATFTEYGEEARDLKVVGAGTARWVAAAVRFACRRLEAGRQVLTDDAGMTISDEAEKSRILVQARRAPLTQHAVRLEPSDAAAVYIADEPEAHLHPAALQSVRNWLTQLAATAATVLVATHSTALLDSTSELVNRVLVLRKQHRTHLKHMTGALAGELARVADDLGLTRGELLLLMRLALFVEGPHDQIILDEWFGDALRAAGIRVFPVHGVDNLPGLAESEITAALGIRIATLSDDTSLSRTSSGSPRTRSEQAVSRLHAEAARAGVQVHSVGLDKPDILYYLDEEVCQRIAPDFPGWDAAQAERSNTGSRVPWKRWIEDQYGLPLTRESIRQLAGRCRQQDKIPAELAQKIHELAAYATAASAPGH
jgi:energy-coupling factor transporter ATP-binding protein EcfA2